MSGPDDDDGHAQRRRPAQLTVTDTLVGFVSASNTADRFWDWATIEGDMNILGILGGDPEVRNGYNSIRVNFEIEADADADDIAALVAQSQKRSAVFDALTNPTNVSVTVA